MAHWKYIVGSAVVAGVATIGALAVARGGDGAADATVPPDSTVPGESATDTGQGRTVAVSGHGAVQVVPDVATVFMGVQTNAPTSQEAMDTLGTKSTALVDTLTALGIAPEDVQTSGLNLWPTYRNDGTTIDGYQASTNVNVTVRDVGRVGEVIDAASGFVGDEFTLGGISFSYDDPEAVMQEARTAAIDNARVRAGQFAEAAGLEVGEVLRISESTASTLEPQFAADAAASAESAVAIAPGSQDLTVDVTVVFAMG